MPLAAPSRREAAEARRSRPRSARPPADRTGTAPRTRCAAAGTGPPPTRCRCGAPLGDLARVRPQDPGQAVQQGRLAAAARPGDGDDLALGRPRCHAAQRGRRAVRPEPRREPGSCVTGAPPGASRRPGPGWSCSHRRSASRWAMAKSAATTSPSGGGRVGLDRGQLAQPLRCARPAGRSGTPGRRSTSATSSATTTLAKSVLATYGAGGSTVGQPLVQRVPRPGRSARTPCDPARRPGPGRRPPPARRARGGRAWRRPARRPAARPAAAARRAHASAHTRAGCPQRATRAEHAA